VADRAIRTTVIGAYPKVGDDVSSQTLRRALHEFDRGAIDQAALEVEFDRVTERAVGEMDESGVDVPNHGCIRWDDLFSPFVRVWRNVSRAALERWFDNNTYFRIPVVTGPIEPTGAATLAELEVARRATRKPAKGAICGPFTFARLADDRHYGNRPALTLAAATALRAELDALGAAGCDLVDVEDPALARWPEDFENGRARRVYEVLTSGLRTHVAVQLSMFPIDAAAARLADLPVTQIGIDVRSRPTRALERIELAGQTLVLGVVDARNTKLETPDEIARAIDAAARRVDASRIWIAPTTSLEYLPHDIVRAKLRALVEGARSALAAGGAR
jgi:5-methyltetrahydropteroyltriglutamate--homocysteine methyltransferase